MPACRGFRSRQRTLPPAPLERLEEFEGKSVFYLVRRREDFRGKRVVIAGGGTKIFTNAPKGRVLLGYPAVKMETHVEIQKALRRLPRLGPRVAALEAVISPSSGVARTEDD